MQSLLRLLLWCTLHRLVSSQCSIYPDGSKVPLPDRVIPFVNLGDVTNPTCGEFEEYALSFQVDCELVQQQAGFCGCPNIPQINACSLCGQPGVSIPDPTKTTPQGDTCGDIEEYIRFLDAETCNNARGESILAFDFLCGCPGVTAGCSLCPNGTSVTNRDLEVADGKCGQVEDAFAAFSESVCQENERLGLVNSVRCGCRAFSEFPACTLDTRPDLCTTDLLGTAARFCECYNFCDGKFHSCSSFPGDFDIQDCPGTLVTGCNYASAIESPPSGTVGTCLVLVHSMILLLSARDMTR